MNEEHNASAFASISQAEMRAADVSKRVSLEAEAWKVAQLAVVLFGQSSDDGMEDAVAFARDFLAEARKQVGEDRQ